MRDISTYEADTSIIGIERKNLKNTIKIASNWKFYVKEVG